MNDDPLAKALESGDNPYGQSRAYTVLAQLFQRSNPLALAGATEQFLQRLVLLEMVLEEVKELEIEGEELETFLAENRRRVDEETAKLAQIFYGRIATREGG